MKTRGKKLNINILEQSLTIDKKEEEEDLDLVQVHRRRSEETNSNRKHKSYSLEDKEKLAKIIKKKKALYDKEVAEKARGSTFWDKRRRMFVRPTIRWGFIVESVLEMWPHLNNFSRSGPEIRNYISVARRVYDQSVSKPRPPHLENEQEKSDINNPCNSNNNKKRKEDQEKNTNAPDLKKRFRSSPDPPKPPPGFRTRKPGGGRKAKASEVRSQLYEWYVKVRPQYEGRFPKKIFLEKCQELYDCWLKKQGKQGGSYKKDDRPLAFSQHWITKWMKEYGVESFYQENYKEVQNQRSDKQSEEVENVVENLDLDIPSLDLVEVELEAEVK